MQTFTPPAGSTRLPDTQRHTCRFQIRSDSSDKLYTIAFDRAASCWQCSCPAFIFRRRGRGVDAGFGCKHLNRYAHLLSAPGAQETPQHRTKRVRVKTVVPAVTWMAEEVADAALEFAE